MTPPGTGAPSPRTIAAPRVLPRSCLIVRSRCGRARCPHRAAAPHGAVRSLASRPTAARSRVLHARGSLCGPVAVGLDGRPSPPVGAPHPPGSRRRAASPVAARHLGARVGIPPHRRASIVGRHRWRPPRAPIASPHCPWRLATAMPPPHGRAYDFLRNSGTISITFAHSASGSAEISAILFSSCCQSGSYSYSS